MSAKPPPVAQRRPYRHSYHGVDLDDPYFWLQDPGYPQVEDTDVLAYLDEENAYFESWYEPHRGLTQTLFEELKGRKPEQDESVPYEKNGYRYQWRFNAGDQYRVWLRQSTTDDSEQWSTLLNENTLAEGCEYFRLGALAVSPDGTMLAFSTDTNGSERFTLKVIDIASGEVLTTAIENCAGSVVWNADSHGFAYRLVNENWRPDKALYRELTSGEPWFYSGDGFCVGYLRPQNINLEATG